MRSACRASSQDPGRPQIPGEPRLHLRQARLQRPAERDRRGDRLRALGALRVDVDGQVVDVARIEIIVVPRFLR
jgi:hypothetical protein